MSAIVESLLNAGLVKSMPDSKDGRKTLMSLTKSCEKLIQEARMARQDWLTKTILQKLSTQEQQQLAKALELLNRLTEDGSLE
jgi:DNA-binding MarR family transcriptional regulator